MINDAFNQAWAIMKAPWYYHATPEKNVMPILQEGIKSKYGHTILER